MLPNGFVLVDRRTRELGSWHMPARSSERRNCRPGQRPAIIRSLFTARPPGARAQALQPCRVRSCALRRRFHRPEEEVPGRASHTRSTHAADAGTSAPAGGKRNVGGTQ